MKLYRPRAGVTLIEMMVVVAIIAVLASTAIWSSAELLPRWRTRAAAKRMAGHIQQCRAAAIQTNKECMVWLIDCDSELDGSCSEIGGTYYLAVGNSNRHSSTWDYLPYDSEADGVDDDQSQGLIELGSSSSPSYLRGVGLDYWGSSIGGPGAGNQDRIVFDPRGFVTNPSTDFNTSGYIELTLVNKVADDKGLNEVFTVSVTRSGMVRVDSNMSGDYAGLNAGTTMASSGS